jgi:hypothetical protein
MQIYIHRNNEQLGPFTEAEVKAQLASGAISLQDHVWWQGHANWIPLDQSPLAASLSPTAPSATPATPSPLPGATAPSVSESVPPTSKLAIWAIVCGFAGIFCGITQIPAIILGHLSLAEIKKNPDLKGRSMAITALVIGYLWLLIVATCVAISLFNAFGGPAKFNTPANSSTVTPDQTTNAPDQTTPTPAPPPTPDQSTNSAPAATNAPDQSTNSPTSSTNSPDSNTNAPATSTNTPDNSTNAAPMTQ